MQTRIFRIHNVWVHSPLLKFGLGSSVVEEWFWDCNIRMQETQLVKLVFSTQNSSWSWGMSPRLNTWRNGNRLIGVSRFPESSILFHFQWNVRFASIYPTEHKHGQNMSFSFSARFGCSPLMPSWPPNRVQNDLFNSSHRRLNDFLWFKIKVLWWPNLTSCSKISREDLQPWSQT